MNVFTHFLITLILLFNVSILIRLWFESRTLKTPIDAEIIDIRLMKFNSYLKQFNKRYYGYEYNLRFQNFKASLDKIAKFNALEGDIVFGLTQFTDMSEKEFAERMGLKHPSKPCTARNEPICNEYDKNPVKNINKLPITCVENSIGIPEKCDWREKGVIGPIQNQKFCLGCWAFGIVGAMESMVAINNGSFVPLSVQELLECSTSNEGCHMGNVGTALHFLCNNRLGIVTEEQYPLTLRYGDECKVKIPVKGVEIKKFYTKCQMDEMEILDVVANHGPVVIVVNAAPLSNYVGGIIRRACVRGKDSNDHVVQIVGFDRTGSIPYYIIRNSWGVLHGINGYVKMAIGHNVCGLAEDVSVITVY